MRLAERSAPNATFVIMSLENLTVAALRANELAYIYFVGMYMDAFDKGPSTDISTRNPFEVNPLFISDLAPSMTPHWAPLLLLRKRLHASCIRKNLGIGNPSVACSPAALSTHGSLQTHNTSSRLPIFPTLHGFCMLSCLAS